MKPEFKAFLKDASLELLVYGFLVVVYFFLVLHFIGAWLNVLFHQNRTGYAFIALGLMLVQGAALEILTTVLLRWIRSERQR
jgi:hypothetical protein